MEFDGIVLIFNGEIYNYRELINTEQLNVKTKSDSEVLIRLYQKYGCEFLSKIHGMFAFCLYDSHLNQFFCATDRFGKKPFYYYYLDGKFIFASEIKAIIRLLDHIPAMEPQALSEYLSFMAPLNGHTFYQGIKKLQAGHSLNLSDTTINIKPYYSIDNIQISQFNENEILVKIEELLLSSVEERLAADVEVATLLSGGIDSSLVSALYAKLSNQKINTFCIGYLNDNQYSETSYAQKVANHIQSEHHELLINRQDFIETIDRMLLHTDQPLGDAAAIPTYLLSQHIHKQGIKVALSGEGSDESFLGYEHYQYALSLLNQPPKVTDFQINPEWEYQNRASLGKTIFQSTAEVFSEKHKTRLFNTSPKPVDLSQYQSHYNPIQWLTYVDFKIWISEVLMTKIDRMSMAHSLELRAPFLDHRLVEYLLKVEPSIKQGNTNKHLLKKIAIKYLPEEIVYRRKKGFSSPYNEWLYSSYGDEILHLILEVNKTLRLFNEDFIKFLYQQAKNNKFKQHLWNLYIFARWFKQTYL